MKKQQKQQQVQQGGEMARVIYQAFMRRPEYISEMSAEERSEVLKMLDEVLVHETQIVKMLTDEWKGLRQKFDVMHPRRIERGDECDRRANRLMGLMRLISMLEKNRIDNLAVYARDN